MKKYYAVLALLISSTAFASKSLTHLEGSYECMGNEVGTNEAFKCQMIIKKTGETYFSTATCSDGNSYHGTGIYDKSTHRLSTGFINPKKSEETGVSVTTINADGSLMSEWTYLDKETLGYTKCVQQQTKS